MPLRAKELFFILQIIWGKLPDFFLLLFPLLCVLVQSSTKYHFGRSSVCLLFSFSIRCAQICISCTCFLLSFQHSVLCATWVSLQLLLQVERQWNDDWDVPPHCANIMKPQDPDKSAFSVYFCMWKNELNMARAGMWCLILVKQLQCKFWPIY